MIQRFRESRPRWLLALAITLIEAVIYAFTWLVPLQVFTPGTLFTLHGAPLWTYVMVFLIVAIFSFGSLSVKYVALAFITDHLKTARGVPVAFIAAILLGLAGDAYILYSYYGGRWLIELALCVHIIVVAVYLVIYRATQWQKSGRAR